MFAAGPTFPLLGVSEWYLWVPIALTLVAGLVFLIRRQRPKVFDLKGAIGELEKQKTYFEGSWSKKVRNAALLKYYVLMAQICSKVGIVDREVETPHQFIGRAAIELDVESSEAEQFAEVVDRAHYGVELSSEEVDSASRFMESFTRVLTGKANLGKE
jgi:hypothetical protein